MLTPRAARLESSLIRDLLAVGDRPGMRSLAGGLPDPDEFPVERLAAAAAAVFADAPARALQYGPTDGLPELRAQLTATPAVQRLAGVAMDDLVVTTGSQQALDLLARVLVEPGTPAAVDDPCYLGARQTFTAGGARLTGVPLDADGMQVDHLAARLRAGYRPAFVYTVPAFQNPTGATLAAERGRELVRLAAHYGFLVIEDDAYGALAFAGEPAAPVPLGGLDRDHVVTVGTVSKVLTPGLRVGWLRGPRNVRDAVVRAKQASDLHTASLNQLLVRELFADEPFLAAHLARLRTVYARKAATLADALGIDSPRGGLFAWTRFAGCDMGALLDQAMDRDVMYVPGAAFAIDADWTEHARLSFATLSPVELRESVATLLSLFEGSGVQ